MTVKPLASLAKIVAGQSPDSSTYNSAGEGLPFFQGKADFQEMYPKVRTWCTSEKRKEAELGDILISVRAPVGAVNICNQKSIIGRGLAAIRPLSELDGRFLYYYLKANERQIDALGVGSTFKAITQDTLKKIEIPFPPLAEQIRIAHLLGKVEGLIAQRKHHLRQFDDLLESVFWTMFGDPVRNEKGWEKGTAIRYADCIVPGRDKPKSFSGETPWVTTGDLQHLGYTTKSRNGLGLTDDEIKEVRARVVPRSSVLLTCVGDLGVVSICARDMVINQQLHAFQISEAMSEEFFMYALSLQKNYMYQNASQTTLPYMNKTVCNGTPMIRPPKDLQVKFSETVKIVYGIKTQYQTSLADLETLYGALSQKAFKGELDVSRVLWPGTQSEETNTVAPENLNTPAGQSIAINLPNPDNLLDALENDQARKILISTWLEAYRSQLRTTPFSAPHFMETAQTQLAELYPDSDFEQGANDYEHIKIWVFEALASHKMTQTFDDATNRLQLMSAQA